MSQSALEYLLAEHRARHPVKRLTFVLSNQADDDIAYLTHKGFERSDSKHCAGSMIAFSKDYEVKRELKDEGAS
jgi:hypothetical protein